MTKLIKSDVGDDSMYVNLNPYTRKYIH